MDELNLLLASARQSPGLKQTPGFVGEVPTGKWWSALLLCILDTGISTERLLMAPRTAYDVKRGVLTSGRVGYPLHAVTVEAISQVLQWPADQLLAWPLDNGRPPFHMLFRYMKEILFRVGLPHVTANLFTRLRITSREMPNALDLVDLTMSIRPRAHQPRLPRKRRPKPKMKSKKRPKLPAVAPEKSLRRFFEDVYAPLKLTGASPRTIESYRKAINRVADWCRHEPSFDLLTDDSIEKFLAWCINVRRLAPASANSNRAHILALWRYAWKKRRVKELPRDVTKVREGKPNPEAWTMDELGRILTATATLEGTVHGVPAADWFKAVVLTLYYTGLRITALLSVGREAYDPESGWLAIPEDVQKHREGQVFQLPADAREAIARITEIQPFGATLFPPLYKRRLYNDYKLCLAKAGLPIGRRDLYHRLRRTCATFVYDRLGLEAAKEYLGHSHPSVTNRYIDRRKLNRVHPTNLLPCPESLAGLLPSPGPQPEGAA